MRMINLIRCRLTNVHFPVAFDTGLSEGVHPLAFEYGFPRIKRILGELVKNPNKIKNDDLFLSRLSVLLYLDHHLNMKLGSVFYQDGDGEQYNKTLSSEGIYKEIIKNLKFFSEEVPDLREFQLKNIPCKGTVESLQAMFYTYQEGRNYTPFKQYLEMTLLSDKAINAVVNYDTFPSETNLTLLQLAMAGQEHILVLSNKETDFYNNRKMTNIKKKLQETSVLIPEDILTYVPAKNHRTDHV